MRSMPPAAIVAFVHMLSMLLTRGLKLSCWANSADSMAALAGTWTFPTAHSAQGLRKAFKTCCRCPACSCVY